MATKIEFDPEKHAPFRYVEYVLNNESGKLTHVTLVAPKERTTEIAGQMIGTVIGRKHRSSNNLYIIQDERIKCYREMRMSKKYGILEATTDWIDMTL